MRAVLPWSVLTAGLVAVAAGLSGTARSEPGKDLCTPISWCASSYGNGNCCKGSILHGMCQSNAGSGTCIPGTPVACDGKVYSQDTYPCDTLTTNSCSTTVPNCDGTQY